MPVLDEVEQSAPEKAKRQVVPLRLPFRMGPQLNQAAAINSITIGQREAQGTEASEVNPEDGVRITGFNLAAYDRVSLEIDPSQPPLALGQPVTQNLSGTMMTFSIPADKWHN